MYPKKIHELPGPVGDFIRLAGRLADEKNLAVYVVGGFVRDLFLGVENFDVDLVVEGDGVAFAAEIARRCSLRLIAHRRFGTATLLGLEGFKADIASARRETYEKPAALPTVSSGGIHDDLFRRDFTINAMAIGIHQRGLGKVVDLYGGQEDLKHRLLRALHPLSFIDDPTRILRAVRFEQRFDLKIEKETLGWIRRAARQRMLHQVQKHRLRDELILMFKEKSPFRCLRRLNELAGLSYIAPSLRFQKAWGAYYENAARSVSWFQEHVPHKRHLEAYVMHMALLFFFLPSRELRKVLASFAFHKKESANAVSLKENFHAVRKELSRKNIGPRLVYRLLEPLTYEVILLIGVLAPGALVSRRIKDFLFVYNGVRLHVRGEDLARLGIKPGPHFKRILEELLDSKIEGKVASKEEELALLEKMVHR